MRTDPRNRLREYGFVFEVREAETNAFETYGSSRAIFYRLHAYEFNSYFLNQSFLKSD